MVIDYQHDKDSTYLEWEATDLHTWKAQSIMFQVIKHSSLNEQ
uniref:Uncharacterized protein n=1 Tax=Rhizophora mucronata TaxID=61149 RepID=A0A2P2NZA9_RHIMU